jgi:hypothetical protein
MDLIVFEMDSFTLPNLDHDCAYFAVMTNPRNRSKIDLNRSMIQRVKGLGTVFWSVSNSALF